MKNVKCRYAITIDPVKGLKSRHIPIATQWFENMIENVLFHFF